MIHKRAQPRRIGRKRRYGTPTTYTARPTWASLIAAYLRGFTAGETARAARRAMRTPRKDTQP